MKLIWYMFKYFVLGKRERESFFNPIYSYYDEVKALTANFLISKHAKTPIKNVSVTRAIYTKDTFEYQGTYNMDSVYERNLFSKKYLIKKVKNWKGEWVKDERQKIV